MHRFMSFEAPSLRRSLFAVMVALGVSWVASSAHAAIVDVQTLNDEDVVNGLCSLREAITAINNQAAYADCPAGTGPLDTITFSVTGTITLTSELPDISGVIIAGPGAEDLTISGADAFGVFVVEGYASINDVTIADGFRGRGAGVYVQDGAGFEAARVVFSGNSISGDPGQGGALLADDVVFMNIIDSVFADNTAPDGGAFFSDDNSDDVVFANCTFANNFAANGEGGAINNRSSGGITIVNSTFFGNSASEGGGAVALTTDTGSITMTHVTVAGNTSGTDSGAVYNSDLGTVTLTSTIVALSSDKNCSGDMTDGGYNLDDGTTCGFSGTSLSDTGAQLDSDGLKDNGGETETIALEPTSAAIDAIPSGTNGCGTTITTDQRGSGFSRPIDGNGDSVAACDTGAFEQQDAVPVCDGEVASIYVSDGVIVGGPRGGQTYKGILRGSEGHDVILGTPGTDDIVGSSGDDLICGGAGDDSLQGGDGDDTLSGGLGADAFKGGQGTDRALDYTPSQADTIKSTEVF